MIEKSPLHLAALAYAAKGIYVFPCISNLAGLPLDPSDRKKPAIMGAFKEATIDPAQIDAWWTDNPNYNIGCALDRSGLCVVDSDGDEGETSWMMNAQSDPDTLVAETPSGGRHRYYRGTLPAGARNVFGEKKEHKVDTRGRGSYTILPPSEVNNKVYKWANDLAEPCALPDWLAVRFDQREKAHGTETKVELDLPFNVARARSELRRFLDKYGPPQLDHGSDPTTVALASAFKGCAVSEATAVEIFMKDWAPLGLASDGSPRPFDREWIETKVQNGYRYAQNDVGVDAVVPASEAFGSALDKLKASGALPPEQPTKRSMFYAEDEDEMEAAKDAVWQFKQWIIERSTGMLYGDSNSFKTFIAMMLALSQAAGIADSFEPMNSGPVFYAALEGLDGLKKSRRRAWRLAHDIKGKLPIYVMKAPTLVFPEEITEFMQEIDARLAKSHPGERPRLIVLETVSKMMTGLDATKDAPKLVRFLDNLRDKYGCTVFAIHHTGHQKDRGPRDSTAYYAGVDWAIEVTAGKDRSKKLVMVKVTKQKDAPEPAEPLYLQGRVCGPSLVFDQIDSKLWLELDGGADRFDRGMVGAALEALKAHGFENGVTSNVIARQMTPINETMTAEQIEAAVAATEKLLNRGAGTWLRGYVSKMGNKYRWHLPDTKT